MKNHRNIIAFPLLFCLFGCTELIEIDVPKNQLTTAEVFADSMSATAAVSNIYYILANQLYSNLNRNISTYTDEYSYTGTSALQSVFNQSSVPAGNTTNRNIWNNLYLIIYSCNDLLEQVPLSKSLSRNLQATLAAEARFLRATAYFYLQNIYGHIPLLLQTDVNINRQAGQEEPQSVYLQIIEDLEQAKSALPGNYPSTGRVRANRWAAAAMLARVHLYQGNWQAAESEASEVINSGIYALHPELSGVFLAGSDEAILQLWTQNGFVSDATTTIPSTPTALPQYVITDALHTAFGAGDMRREEWIAGNMVTAGDGPTVYHYAFKYKNRTPNATQPEYLMVLRLAEQYLIRAEARAQQGNTDNAIEDINAIRERAGLQTLESGLTQAECLSSIAGERRTELFGEWGHRFMDLKRAGILDEVMAGYKATWRTGVASVFPLPQDEISYNANLIQNDGY